MAKKPPPSPEELKVVWYAKLKKSGFQDIETDRGVLKTWSSRFASKKVQRDYDAKMTYHYMAAQFLNNYKFASRFERIVWEYHSEAISADDIAEVIFKLKITKLKKASLHTTIIRIIKRLRHEMKKLYLNGYKYNE